VRFDVVTLFPELFPPFLTTGMVGRATGTGVLEVGLHALREFGLGKHRSVDDTPYGGGSGMVMRVDCIVACLEAVDAAAEPPAHRVLLTPQGAPFRQAAVPGLLARGRVALICGRYEGFDERVRGFVQEELSLGDFVLTGGELAAMVVIDACSRFLPGVLGNAASTLEESHSPENAGMLEYPQYTRPAVFRGLPVPEVLTQGNHGAIAAFRRAASGERTLARRPDLYAAAKAEKVP
jgi:tRNA (guanine37-N1)-methyltransferase